MILLDTHVWVWWLSASAKIPRKAQRAISEAVMDRSVYVSSISSWEIALLAARDRLKFTMDAQDWIARSEALPFIRFVPVDNSIAIRSVRLPTPFHKDPADRIIVATALMMGAPLVTSDSKLLKYEHIETIWK